METRKRGGVFAFIAAAFFTAATVYYGYGFVGDVIDCVKNSGEIYYSIPPFIANVVYLTGLLALAVTLILRFRIGALISTALIVLSDGYWVVENFEYGGAWSTFLFLAFLLLAVLLALAVLKKRAAAIRYFLPAASALAGNALGVIEYDYLSDLKGNWKIMLFLFAAEVLGLLFAGLWLLASRAPAQEVIAVQPAAPEPDRSRAAAPESYSRNAPVFCGKCGTRAVAGAPFCLNCGAPLAGPKA